MCATRGWEQATPHDTRHRRSLVPAKPSKYRAKPTVVDGIRFDSKRESERYVELKLMQKAGEIQDLRLQPRFQLLIKTLDGPVVCVGTYVADFAYEKLTGAFRTVVEDVKGVLTPVYRLKKKLVQALYGIEIREVR